MPAAPPAPGVATFRAAAMSEGKDPDQAVQEARTKVSRKQTKHRHCAHPLFYRQTKGLLLRKETESFRMLHLHSQCCCTSFHQFILRGLAVQGEIPTLTELPAPWGPKPYVASAAEAAHGPAIYPEGFSPLNDTVKPALAM